MRLRGTPLLFAIVAAAALTADRRVEAQSQATLALPSSRSAIVAYDVEMVKRLAALLSSPARWNRADNGQCPSTATSFSILCGMQYVLDSAAAQQRVGNGKGPAVCHWTHKGNRAEGSCGWLFDELPVFTLARASAPISGRWRDDATPTEVWIGVMNDAAAPVRFEARRAVDAVSNKRYPGRLVGFNNDSATTFADVQRYLGILADRVASRALEDFASDGDTVEVEVYPGGTGVIRTYTGWFPVSRFDARGDSITMQFDVANPVAPNAFDRSILERAAAILHADSVWNRADDRKCAATARTFSIYCAVQKATIEITGAFHHRRPAAELVRVIVDERTKDRSYEHRLMEYNNDPRTTLADVRSLFAEALARIH